MTDAPSTIYVEDETLRSGFTAIPNYILRHPHISAGAKLAYFVLLSYAWQEGSCFPGQERMALDMGCAKRSIVRYLQELQDAGLVVIKRRGLGQTNLYTLPKWDIIRSAKSALQGVTEGSHQQVPQSRTKKTQVKQGR